MSWRRIVVLRRGLLLCPRRRTRRRRSTRPPRGVASKRSGEGREIESWEARLEQWRGRCGGQPFAAVAAMPAGRYSRVVGGRVLSGLSARAGRLCRRASAHLRQRERRVVGLARRDSRRLVSGFPLVRDVHHPTHVFHVGRCPIFVYIFRTSSLVIERASWLWCRFASHQTANRTHTHGTAH